MGWAYSVDLRERVLAAFDRTDMTYLGSRDGGAFSFTDIQDELGDVVRSAGEETANPG
jgi:hypothetical protein